MAMANRYKKVRFQMRMVKSTQQASSRSLNDLPRLNEQVRDLRQQAQQVTTPIAEMSEAATTAGTERSSKVVPTASVKMGQVERRMKDYSGATSRAGELRVVGRQLKREEGHLGRIEKDLRERMGKIRADLDRPDHYQEQQQQQPLIRGKRAMDKGDGSMTPPPPPPPPPPPRGSVRSRDPSPLDDGSQFLRHRANVLDKFGRIYESEAKLMTLFAVEESGQFHSRIKDMRRLVELQEARLLEMEEDIEKIGRSLGENGVFKGLKDQSDRMERMLLDMRCQRKTQEKLTRGIVLPDLVNTNNNNRNNDPLTHMNQNDYDEEDEDVEDRRMLVTWKKKVDAALMEVQGQREGTNIFDDAESYNDEEEDLDDLVEAVDGLMFRAKKLGLNVKDAPLSAETSMAFRHAMLAICCCGGSKCPNEDCGRGREGSE